MYTTDEITDRRGNHPYILEFKHRLRDTGVTIEELGTPGARATDLLFKLAPILAKQKKSTPAFVFILAGTNDLAYRTSQMTILWYLKKMHKTVRQYALSIKRNVYSMAITIPPIRWDVNQTQRLLLNAGLQKYAMRCSDFVAFLDLEPVFNVSQKETAYLWSRDALHLSKAGYDRMGGMVYDKMVEFLSQKGEESLHSMDFDAQCQ
jgi:lysophospholipase L1-like esterase